MTPRPSLGRNLATLTAGEACARALTFVAFVHLARVLQPASYGWVELSFAVLMFLTLAVDQGFGVLGTREVAGREVAVEPWITSIISAQLLCAGAVYAVLLVAVIVLPIAATLRWLLLGFALSLFAFPFSLPWLFQARNRMVPVAVLQVVRQAMFAAVAIAAVRAPEQLLRLPFAEVDAVIAAAAGYLILMWRGGERVRVSLRAGWNPALFRESVPIGASQLVWALRMYLPIILLAVCADRAAVGLFGAGHRVVMVGQTIQNVYFTTLFPLMSAATFRSTEELTRLLRRSVRLVLWPSIAGAMAVVVSAPLIIRLIFGTDYGSGQAAATLAVLVWMLPIFAWRRHDRSALIALNRQREELVCSLAGVVLLGALALPLSRAYGPVGAAWAMVASELAGTALTWWRLKHYVPVLRLSHHLFGRPVFAHASDRHEVYLGS